MPWRGADYEGEFPTLGWQVGDVLDWRIKDEAIILSRLNDGSPCDPIN